MRHSHDSKGVAFIHVGMVMWQTTCRGASRSGVGNCGVASGQCRCSYFGNKDALLASNTSKGMAVDYLYEDPLIIVPSAWSMLKHMSSTFRRFPERFIDLLTSTLRAG